MSIMERMTNLQIMTMIRRQCSSSQVMMLVWQMFLTMDDGIDFINHYRGAKNLISDIREALQQKGEPIQIFKDAILVQ